MYILKSVSSQIEAFGQENWSQLAESIKAKKKLNLQEFETKINDFKDVLEAH